MLVTSVRNAIRSLSVDTNGDIYHTGVDSHILFRNDTSLVSIEPRYVLDGMVWRNHTLYICGKSSILMYSPGDHAVLSTLVGTGRDAHKDGTFKEAKFNTPTGLAVDKNGNIYVTENICIRKINLFSRTVETVAGATFSKKQGHKDGNAEQAQFTLPSGIAVAEDTSIYVADTYNQCIRRIMFGVVRTIAGQPGKRGAYTAHETFDTMEFCDPRDIAISNQGDLFVCDAFKVRKINWRKKKISVLILAEEEQISSLCFDPEGNLMVSRGRDIFKFEYPWKRSRYLWIALLKEDPTYCSMATLPRDIIKYIACFLDYFQNGDKLDAIVERK